MYVIATVIADACALTSISDVIVAFTAQPGQVARFQLTAANKEENARSKGFACIGINSTWPKRSFHVRSVDYDLFIVSV